MTRRAVSILSVLALCIQVVFGGLGGAAAICLGGGHEHAPDEVDVTSCELTCSHESEWPTPVPVDDHDDGCECTDLELTLADLLNRPREAGDVVPAAVRATSPWIVPDVSLVSGPNPVWHDPWDDPGGRARIALVRSTRLLL